MTRSHGQAAAKKLRLFVVHAPADFEFVEGFLLGAVGLPRGELLCSSNLEPGATIVDEVARGAVSPVTVVLASPAFLASPWARFAEQLALHHSVEAADGRSATLVPLILVDCCLPLLSRVCVALDFRKQEREHSEAEVAKCKENRAHFGGQAAGADRDGKDRGVSGYPLVLMDRAYLDAAVFHELSAANRHWLTPAKSTTTWRVIKTLGKDDQLVEMELSSEARKKHPHLPTHFDVRAIRYQRQGHPPRPSSRRRAT